MRRERIHVWKSERESAMLFVEVERVRFWMTIDAMQQAGMHREVAETKAAMVRFIAAQEKRNV